MKILNFGSCNIDSVYRVDRIVRSGETVASRGLVINAGGKGLNQSLALARSGAAVYHAGCIGADGAFLRELLEAAGANTEFLKTLAEKTGCAIIQVDDNGENSILLHQGANHAVTREYVDQVLAAFQAGDLLILQNEISNLGYLVEKAYEKGLSIALNPSPINAAVKALDLSKIDYLILNQGEGCELTGKTEPEEICHHLTVQHLNMKVVLTLGKRGACYAAQSQRAFCGAFPVKAVDTTGAGDTFLGYFLSVYTQTGDVEAALKTANMAAALATTQPGAAAAIPCMAQVLEALAQI